MSARIHGVCSSGPRPRKPWPGFDRFVVTFGEQGVEKPARDASRPPAVLLDTVAPGSHSSSNARLTHPPQNASHGERGSGHFHRGLVELRRASVELDCLCGCLRAHPWVRGPSTRDLGASGSDARIDLAPSLVTAVTVVDVAATSRRLAGPCGRERRPPHRPCVAGVL
jgi:hypothetical protein